MPDRYYVSDARDSGGSLIVCDRRKEGSCSFVSDLEQTVVEIADTGNFKLADRLCKFMNNYSKVEEKLQGLDKYVGNTRMHSTYRLKILNDLQEIKNLTYLKY